MKLIGKPEAVKAKFCEQMAKSGEMFGFEQDEIVKAVCVLLDSNIGFDAIGFEFKASPRVNSDGSTSKKT